MKHLITVICGLIFTSALAQDFSPTTITVPEHPAFSDLSFLKEEFKNANVVMLGEMTHQDGNIFEMKTRIVEYLVSEMGFTTIAFESGIYDVWEAQKKISKGVAVKEALTNALFSVWTDAGEFQSFISFFESNRTRLRLFGFDNQMTGTASIEGMVNGLYTYCKANKLKIGLDKDDFTLLLESVTRSGMFDEEDILYEEYRTALARLHERIFALPQTEQSFYWDQIVKSLATLGEDAANWNEVLSSFNTTASDNIRDRQMANNLLAYIKLHPEEKIICWGANQHFATDMASVTAPVLKDFVPMGSYVKKELNEKLYSLAAVTAADSVFLEDKWNRTPVQANSFESFLKRQKGACLFISSGQPEMGTLQFNRLFSPITFTEARLDKLHDGYLYFDKAVPSTMLIADDSSSGLSITSYHKTLEAPNEMQFVVPEGAYNLEELVLYSRQTPYQILRKSIEKQHLNYPEKPFGSTLYTDITAKAGDSEILSLEIIAGQYDHGYVGHENRSVKKLKEIRWNTESIFEPQSLKEFHGLMYNSPLQYAALLNKKKFKKFDLILDEEKMVDGEEVYVISFSSPRKHSTYTDRVYLSNYYGYMHINKNDHAVVKISETWEVTEFPQHFKQGYRLTGNLAKYIYKEYRSESTLSEFKKVDGRYYLSYALNSVNGELIDAEGNSLPYEVQTESTWYDFSISDPGKIPYKDEQLSFNKVKYNEDFWKQFKTPK